MIYIHHLTLFDNYIKDDEREKTTLYSYLYIILLDMLLKSEYLLDQEDKCIMLNCFLGSKLDDCELVQECTSTVPLGIIIR